MNNRKVFVANRSGVHNYSAAEEFGDIIFVTEGRINRLNTTAMVIAFQEALANSSPEDFILTTGPSVLNCVGCAVFAHMHGRINLLLYKNLEYKPREIMLDNRNL